MSELYGPRRTFATRSAADSFGRHVTRELTAGGLPHWIEAVEQSPGRWTIIVHRESCKGGAACSCGSSGTPEG